MRATGPWGGFLLAPGSLYLLIAVVLLLGGAPAGQAWGTPAAVLVGPALGVGVVRYRGKRAGRTR
ncbi:hypothetical protein ACLIYM_26790 [Streptomyces fenghuangensis]|uniref:hypothetical protein n=1 Tax=Streptomyces sp. ICN903 TaxID=2964654 RepID=UPI001EDC312C|nr:hypothetical protein [Streptomyces sp. ICN903]MCG3041398.1 hypothetical protein [Streptomyces sp. ICN903]